MGKHHGPYDIDIMKTKPKSIVIVMNDQPRFVHYSIGPRFISKLAMLNLTLKLCPDVAQILKVALIHLLLSLLISLHRPDNLSFFGSLFPRFYFHERNL